MEGDVGVDSSSIRSIQYLNRDRLGDGWVDGVITVRGGSMGVYRGNFVFVVAVPCHIFVGEKLVASGSGTGDDLGAS
jgi:hypothetical protein